MQAITITRETVKVLLTHGKRVRILTRSPLWTRDLDILVHPNVTVGMSIPYLDDDLSRQIEPFAPQPSDRLRALAQGTRHGCRVYVAMAPTPPMMGLPDFVQHLEELMAVNPEVIFWEPMNARGSNGKRMLAAGLEFTHDVMSKAAWALCFLRQWGELEVAAERVGCVNRLHIWPDRALAGRVGDEILRDWWHRPTVENWRGRPPDTRPPSNAKRPLLQQTQPSEHDLPFSKEAALEAAEKLAPEKSDFEQQAMALRAISDGDGEVE